MSKGTARQGWDMVEQESERREKLDEREYLPFFKLEDGEEAKVTFLNAAPYVFHQHFVKRMNRAFVCSEEDDCPLCNMGNKASFRGGFLIIDHREDQWKDRESGETKTRQYTLKEMNMSHSTCKIMKKKHDRKGLLEHDWIITRTGKSTNTRYDFEAVEKDESVPMPDEIPELENVYMPPERDWLLQKLAEHGLGQPSSNQPIVEDEDEGVIDFN